MIDIDAILFDLAAAAKTAPPAKAAAVLRLALHILRNAPRPAPCQWRGALVEKASCGCADRNIYECNHPAVVVDGFGVPVLGKACRECKYAKRPEAKPPPKAS